MGLVGSEEVPPVDGGGDATTCTTPDPPIPSSSPLRLLDDNHRRHHQSERPAFALGGGLPPVEAGAGGMRRITNLTDAEWDRAMYEAKQYPGGRALPSSTSYSSSSSWCRTPPNVRNACRASGISVVPITRFFDRDACSRIASVHRSELGPRVARFGGHLSTPIISWGLGHFKLANWCVAETDHNNRRPGYHYRLIGAVQFRG